MIDLWPWAVVGGLLVVSFVAGWRSRKTLVINITSTVGDISVAVEPFVTVERAEYDALKETVLVLGTKSQELLNDLTEIGDRFSGPVQRFVRERLIHYSGRKGHLDLANNIVWESEYFKNDPLRSGPDPVVPDRSDLHPVHSGGGEETTDSGYSDVGPERTDERSDGVDGGQ